MTNDDLATALAEAIARDTWGEAWWSYASIEQRARFIDQARPATRAVLARRDLVVPVSDITRRITELDARIEEDEPYPWGDRDPSLEARASELRVLIGQETS